MLLYELKVQERFDRVTELAENIREKFDTDASADDLLRDVSVLQEACESLTKLLPRGVGARSLLGRHLHFLNYWLELNQKQNCESDICDICQRDLPALKKAFYEWSAGPQHYDAEFSEKIVPLLENHHLDSAVRKAFVLLKERLVRAFGAHPELDGPELVNAVFGQKGTLAGKIPDPDREAMRDLLAGLYRSFRNRYSHNDVAPEWYEVEAVLSMMNWALRTLDRYRSITSGQFST